MMFLDGYIGEPPTVTVCSFICANVGVAATAAKASAAAATAAGTMVRESFMTFSICLGPRQRLANGDTRGPEAGMQGLLGPGRSQTRQLAGGDGRAGGLPGRRAARRLERHRERRVGRNVTDEVGRNVELDPLALLHEAERARLLPGPRQDQPELDRAGIVGEQRGRPYG